MENQSHILMEYASKLTVDDIYLLILVKDSKRKKKNSQQGLDRIIEELKLAYQYISGGIVRSVA